MREPSRLLESSESEIERRLLRAGRDRAPRGAKGRAFALGVGAVAASSAANVAAAAEAGNAAASAAGAGKAAVGAKAAFAVSLKWVVVVGLASVGAAAGTVAVRAAHAPHAAVVASESSVLPVQPSAPGARAATPALRSQMMAPIAPQLPAPVPPATPVVPAVHVAPATPTALPGAIIAPSHEEAAGSSSAELAMLDDARRAIDGRNPAGALATLDQYRTRFPHGVMGPEASVLRIEALIDAGDRSAARRVADAFTRANPGTPYAARIASLLGASNP